MNRITRREAFGLGAATVVGAAVGGTAVGAVLGFGRAAPSAEGPPAVPQRVSLDWWRRTRRAPYFIGDRGAGDVVPEHTIPSYVQALDWGARCLALSVVVSSDGVAYCLQDETLDRTTTLRGRADRTPARVLDTARVNIPRLGPRWIGSAMPKLPRLSAVLTEVGGRAALTVKPRSDRALGAVLKAVTAARLSDTVMIKLRLPHPQLASIKKAGLAVVADFDDSRQFSARSLDVVRRALDREKDALCLPAQIGASLIAPDVVRRAVDTGLPVWTGPVHRRCDVQSLVRLGVEGFVTPDLGYLSGSVPPQKVDDWASGALSAGELTKDPLSDAYAVQWPEDGVIGLDFKDRPSFLTMGQFGPIEADSYRITFDARFNPLPTDTWQHLSIAFGHKTDRYYEHRLGTDTGYHAQVRADGSLALYAHLEGDPNGQALTPTKASAPLRSGEWLRMTLDVTPQLIRWSRDDGTSVEVKDARFRGGYFHLGRSEKDGRLELRNLAVA